MKLIVGLGNVGEKYKNTRHNAGFMAVDKLAPLVKKNRNIILFKPDTMMNASGKAVHFLATNYKLLASDIYVIHDDLDIKLGEYKIQMGRGPKVHNGINSIENSLRETDFWRVRIGVDNRQADNRIAGEEYVLQDFTKDEREVVERTINEICKKLATF